MGFRALRVINEDWIAPGRGFPTHGHRDMEIVTVVVSGALEHRDDLGNGEVIRPGDVQHMSAGTGVQHSEFNPSPTEAAHILQIWLLPEAQNIPAGYSQKHFDVPPDDFTLVASQDGRNGSVKIHQDLSLYEAKLETEQRFSLKPDRHAWLQVIEGQLSLNGVALATGDGAAISQESELLLMPETKSRLLLFDLA